MSGDPWAAAEQGAAQQGNGGSTLVQDSVPASQGSGESQLFKQQGEKLPSLFNKTHPLGTVRTGVIKSVKDVHSLDFNTKKLKYWEDSQRGQKGQKPVFDAISPLTQKPNQPVWDTFVELETDYRLTAAECTAVGRDVADVEKDDGRRIFVAGGHDLKVVREAIAAAAPSLGLTKTEDLIGKRLTVKRAGQHPNPGGNPSWVLEVAFTRA